MGAAYQASKHGVVGLTKGAALEYASRGVRINAVAPGVIHTAMADRAGFSEPQRAARIVGLHPLGRVGTAQEVADAVLWLCSPASAFVTGHTLPVDGGYLIP
jgi:NAD(P)-dependent dehydrogenase (short-subunit alcohol dehydrogenase family)